MGGIGAGMVCMEGTGSLSHVSLRHTPELLNEPIMFSAIYIKNTKTARILEGPVRSWKIFGTPRSSLGGSGTTWGLPRFRKCSFSAKFPFATVLLEDNDMPVTAELTGWSPFIPADEDSSSLPVFALEYYIVMSYNSVRKKIIFLTNKNLMKNIISYSKP